MLKIINAQFPQPAPKPMRDAPDPSWIDGPEDNGQYEWEMKLDEIRENALQKAGQMFQGLNQVITNMKTTLEDDELALAYVAKKIFAEIEGTKESSYYSQNPDRYQPSNTSFNGLAAAIDKAIEHHLDNIDPGSFEEEDPRIGEADARMDEMKDDSFQWDNPW